MTSRFEFKALILLALLVIGLIYISGLKPFNYRALFPNVMPSVLETGSILIPVPPVFSSPLMDINLFKNKAWKGKLVFSFSEANKFSHIRVAQEEDRIDTLTGVFSISAIDKKHRQSLSRTSGGLLKAFKEIGYDLKQIRSGEITVPRFFLTRLPGDLNTISRISVRKALFFKSVLPLVLKINEEILQDRRRLLFIQQNINLGKTLDRGDRLWLAGVAKRYGQKNVSVTRLLKQVDIIPPSIALAQAAIESGWGTSRFVRDGNAIFGQWTFSKTNSLLPSKREHDRKHRVRSFESLIGSVRAYTYNLNTHRAYERLRKIRNSLRLKGKPIRGMLLVNSLKKYSQLGDKYIVDIRNLIIGNNLQNLDGAQLQGNKVNSIPYT